MHTILQMTKDENGDPFPYGKNWHLRMVWGGTNTLFCTGEVFDEEGGVDAEGYAKCISKNVVRGGVTCPKCLEAVKVIKSIKL